MKVRWILSWLMILSIVLIINCQTVKDPNKIQRLAMLSTQPNGATVEFSVWVKDITGDDKLGLELLASETPDTYPVAIIVLKDGQQNLSKEKYMCFRGQIMTRDEVEGGIVYRIKNAEVIECY